MQVIDELSISDARPIALSETAVRLSQRDQYLHYEVSSSLPSCDVWFRLDELDSAPLLEGWHHELAGKTGDRRVAAAYLSNWLLSMAAGIWLFPTLAERRLPAAEHSSLAVRRTDGGWFDAMAVADPSIDLLADDPAAGSPGTTVVNSVDALHDRLADRLLGLESVISAFRDACPIGGPALWGALADAVGAQTLRLAHAMGRDRGEAWRDAEAVIKRMSARQPGIRTRPQPVPVMAETFFVRGTCCLYYRTVEAPDRDGEGYCDTCPLRTPESRLTRMRATLDA